MIKPLNLRGRTITANSNSAKASTAAFAGRGAYWFLHTFLKGGSSLPGKIASRIDPDVLAHLGRDYDVIVVTGTNGKTLTTNLIVKVLKQKYNEILTNPTGSNMMQGIITAFLAQPKSGKGRGIAVLEVDEANVAPVAKYLHPKAFVLTNIFRDQMDRYGEFYTTYQKILDGINLAPDALVIANGDAPIFSSREFKNPVRYFGFESHSTEDLMAPPNTDGVLCPVCSHILHYHDITYSNLGDFFCPNCGFKRPELTNQVTQVNELTPTHSTFAIDQHPYTIQIGGMYNIYNALAAYAVGEAFEVSPDEVAKAFAYDEKVFGRQEVVHVGDKAVTLVLVKNPVGLNEVLDMISHQDKPFALATLLNANYADGIDTSWIWDGNFEEFVAGNHATSYLAGGERYQDIAYRFKVAGVPEDELQIIPDLGDVIKAIPEFKEDQVYLLATYTAILQLRKKLADEGYIKAGF
ncbi:Mur ligase family protein [Lacticaseibacillus saniviri]|uniref:Lipid II isoglutaminyl synthase (glutamine-hydrolyzing) subunit MurT n=1 Tax=Lacticaseibacillus saniviri JCM 17471 = DSM 24301 TaxID=1293598 RepID=A0A0R2MZL3_9LACO|nr:Mur ligase family protein [Lacticaseibacillus saniviri]KRO17632.1 UDP-N-acetylmuramyl tripeptide synthase [Lacticaseibacillus saniviri JCM 17471 = DSM 24301]